MKLRIREPALRSDFARHFERAGFSVDAVDDAIVVDRPDAPDPAQARRDVDAHAHIWQVMHPEAPVERLD
jgi:hypothetical protein